MYQAGHLSECRRWSYSGRNNGRAAATNLGSDICLDGMSSRSSPVERETMLLFATTLKASHTLSSVLLGLHASGLPWPLHDVGFLSNLRLPISNFLRKYTHGV